MDKALSTNTKLIMVVALLAAAACLFVARLAATNGVHVAHWEIPHAAEQVAHWEIPHVVAEADGTA